MRTHMRGCFTTALLVGAAVALSGAVAAPAATAHAGTHATTPPLKAAAHLKRTKRPRTAPRRRLQHQRPRAVTVYVGGDAAGMLVAENRGCTNWFWFSPGARYVYYCQTGYFMAGEWQYTDYAYRQWTGSSWTYYGTYRCWKDSGVGSNVVIVGAPATTRCGWV